MAARYAGINNKTFYNWLRWGEKAKEGPYWEFFHAIKDAEGYAEVVAVAQVRAAAKDNWQAAMTWLERKFPDRWGRHERPAVDGGGITIRIINDTNTR